MTYGRTEAPSYTLTPEYQALHRAVLMNPRDWRARNALVDWVRDQGDRAEAIAIRAFSSLRVDLFPAIDRLSASRLGPPPPADLEPATGPGATLHDEPGGTAAVPPRERKSAPPGPTKNFVHVGPAAIIRAAEGLHYRFKGRVIRHETTGAYRFCVNRLPSGNLPSHWPDKDEWTDAFDLADVEWVGRKPNGV